MLSSSSVPDEIPAMKAGGPGWQWIRACLLGELFGFVPLALTGAVLFAIGAPEVGFVIGLTLAGVLEGLILGSAQADVLRRVAPTVPDWAATTGFAVGLAWFVGIGGSSLVHTFGPWALVIAAPGWIIGLSSMGFLQSCQLRQGLGRSGSWFSVSIGALLACFTIPVASLAAPPNDWPSAVFVTLTIISTTALGVAVGAVSARTLIEVVPETSRDSWENRSPRAWP
ncbi:MAG: hypothetical protein ACI8TP_000997 [Acidimicrobiales bacterium]|jgi:hypothetical protein